MDLLQLKYVVAIAESESMTQAAERMHISQSALSLSYKRLEEELGVGLFRREGRKLALTEAGVFFCRNASVILGLVDKLTYDMTLIRGSEESRISYTSEAGDFTNEAKILFQEFFPEREVNESRDNARQTLESLRQGKVPFAVTYEDLTNDFLTSELILSEPMYAFLNVRSPLAGEASLRMEQLQGRPLVTQREDYTVCQVMRRYYTHTGVMPGKVHYIGDPESMSLQVYNGLGGAFIPESVVNLWKRSPFDMAPGTKMIPMEDPVCCRHLYLTYPRDAHFPEMVRHYMEYLRHFGALTQKLRCFPNQQELQAHTAQCWPDFCALQPGTPRVCY